MNKKSKSDRKDEYARSLVFNLQKENKECKDELERLRRAVPAQTKLQKHSYLFSEMPHSIRDPVYGNVPLSKEAFQILNTKNFQRLKRLFQTGPAFHVYPGLQHSRFEHSVGVYYLMRLALQHFVLLPNTEIEPEHGLLALCAALLHDLGQYPYSHVSEEIKIKNKHLSHEEHTAYLIQNDTELNDILSRECGIKPEDIAKVLSGKKEDYPRFLTRLLDSTIDLDKMDYLVRDAYHAGVPYGDIDAKWLISSFRVDEEDGDLLIVDGGIGAVEQMIFAKYLMYRNIYWHHTTREVTAMIKRALLDFLLENGLESLDLKNPNIQKICYSTDSEFFATLKEISGNKLPLSTTELLERLQSREIYKRVHVIYSDTDPEKEENYLDAINRLNQEKSICDNLSELPEWKYPKLRDWDILIDVAKKANFKIDIAGVYFEDPPKEVADKGLHVVDWDKPQYVSHFTSTLLTNMENGIRKIRYFYNPDTPAGVDLRNILRSHQDFY